MKTINYPKLADVLEECVLYAKKLKVNMENPEGKRENFRISDISIALLNYHDRSVSIKQGIAGEVIALNQRTEISIQMWVSNSHKKVRTGYSYCRVLPDEDYLEIFFRKIIDTCITSAVNAFFTSKVKSNKFSLASEEAPLIDIQDPPIIDELYDEGVKSVNSIFRWMYTQPNIVGVNGNLNINRKVWIVCNSDGKKISQYQDLCSFVMNFTYLSNKKNLIEDSFVDYYVRFADLLTDLPEIKNKLIKKLAKMEMKRIDSGIYPILLKPSAVCTLFHEAIAGHMLSAKYILDGNSTVFENKLGKRFANNGDMPRLVDISVYDKPLEEGMIASYKYDMEGTSAQNVCLLDKGVVRNYLTDRNSAARLKQKSNGHFLAEEFIGTDVNGTEFAIRPEPRVSNLFVESHTDITIEDIQEAIFEQSPWYLEVESRNGAVFVDTGTFDLFADHITRVYKDGKREAICPGTLSSNLTDFLSSIQIVSNHYGESKGLCGSSSGYVPTHEVAPSMLIYGINFVTDPKPEKSMEIDLSRSKFIPEGFIPIVIGNQNFVPKF